MQQQPNQQTSPPAPDKKAREASLTVATGYQGTGKSYQTLYAIRRYLALHPDRKVLIYDVNGEFDEENCLKHGCDLKIPKLAPIKADIIRFSAHQTERIRRIVPIDPVTGKRYGLTEMKDLLKMIMQNFSKGLLLLEDMNKYILNVRHLEEVVSILISLRHNNLDAIIHLQTMAKIDPTIWENAKYIRMHWQTDSIDRIEKRVPYYKLVRIAKFIVDYYYYEKKDKRFYLWVLPQENKLYGSFSKADFKLALYRYLKAEQKELKESCVLNGLDYKNVTERLQAVERLYTRYLDMMYGNDV